MSEGSDVRQHDMLKAKIEGSLRPEPQPELTIALPPKLKIQDLAGQSQVDVGGGILPTPTLQQQESDAMALETPTMATAPQQQGPTFAPIKLFIEFEVASFRDGIHWIGYTEGDRRFPYMYTKVQPWPGSSSCIFPCVDDATTRCSWDISIRCARTLGEAFRQPKLQEQEQTNGDAGVDVEMMNGTDNTSKLTATNGEAEHDYLIDLSDEEAALDLAVVCIGDSVDDIVDSEDETHHTASFALTQPVCARHVAFAIGPFEHVDLSATRDIDEEDRLGQSAFKISGYCLPGKSKDSLNTCYPIAWAMDKMGINYGSFPFSSYQILFLDDLVHDTAAAAGFSLFSTYLLFPKTIIEPLYRNTRTLIRALADQWSGVNVIAKEASDAWVVAGIAGFMTDAYMKDLAGNNEFRWQQKLAAEKVYELDVDRPSIRQLGELLHLDEEIREFVNVKSALVLFILDRRLMKASGSTGVQRIINKLFLNAKTGALVNGEVSTADFQRTCERLGHNKLELFFRQWVFQSGCPIFYVTQRFNKKKLVVEMTIVQKQLERVTKPAFAPDNFMREVKEHVQEVWAPETNPVFTGPMTIRIHEADGTPYEHIVEIKEATTRLEIPYNTKYKRLKRSRRQRERAQQNTTADAGEGEETGSLLYCLGDILDTEEEKREWDLADWTPEDEEKMGQESYEWIRMDADFEWIGKIHLVMPLYMYISQLQQDRDIVAQYESMRYLLGSNPHHVSLSILVRTLMDGRYFWGIRELAAEGLAGLAKDRWKDIGAFHLTKAFRTLYCLSDEANMPRGNDFSDRRRFVLQCAIPKAMAKLRDEDGRVPMPVRQFFVDLLKFNDNSNNWIEEGDDQEGKEAVYSDNHYIANLMSCLADALIASHREPKIQQPQYTFTFDDDAEDMPMEPPIENNEDAEFEKVAIAQIERIRRIDEWDPSYQNLYSTTALECLQRLTRAGIVKDKTQEVMKYTREGNAENVRLAAWKCLSEIGVLRKVPAARYLLRCLADDASPRFRDGLMKVLGEALGHLALGDLEPERPAPQPEAMEGLVLEQEVSSEARRLQAVRKTTPEGALVALKTNPLINDDAFKTALWHAATSEELTLDEVAALCETAALVYESINSLTLRLRLPRMWRAENMGQGKVRFIAHQPFRSVPTKGLTLLDWENLEKLGLQYSGPLSTEVQQKKAQAEQATSLKLKIAQTQQQLQAQQAAQHPEQAAQPVAVEMPPPTAIGIAPSVERQPSFKISLGGNKRKQSVDLGRTAGSPKAPKVSRQQSPADTIHATPRGKATSGSPARNQRRSSTPSSKASTGKAAKGSKWVALRLGSKAAKAQEILSSPPQSGQSQQQQQGLVPPVPTSTTPVLPQQPAAFPASGLAVQSPTNSMNLFSGSPGIGLSASPLQAMNLGGFRSYGPPPEVPDADMSPSVEMKQEDSASLVAASESPAAAVEDAPIEVMEKANGDVAPTREEVTEEASAAEVNQDMPPPPRPKLTLKLGARRASSQGSPE